MGRGQGGRGAIRALFWLLLCLLGADNALAASIEFTDMAGRQVRLDDAPKRIALGDGRLLTAFALVTPEPLARVIASTDNLKRYDPATYDAYLAKFPTLADVTDLGPPSADLSAEGLLSVAPDLVLLPLWLHSDRNIEETLAAAGVPVAYVDFFSDPVAGLPKALRIIGAVLERQEQAEAYLAFVERHMETIRKRLADAQPKRPKVFLHARSAEWDCCWSATGKVGEIIAFAGGENIASGMMGGQTGQLSLEFVLGADPDIYIAAASSGATRPGDFPIGEGVAAADVQAALQAIRGEPALGTLSAVTKGRAHALWLFFFQSPTYIVAVEAMAKWFHPDLFADIDPARTLAEINSSYMAVAMTGTFFADMEPETQP
jgi:iron complex transport system substrate-binding protein